MPVIHGTAPGVVFHAATGLDEAAIAAVQAQMRRRILRVIEDGKIRRLGGECALPVDVRFVAASNRDLEAESRAGAFRADLYHRLSVFRLMLPPLRARIEDVRQLVPLFEHEFNAKAGKRVRHIGEPVWVQMLAHDWPGNVRELRNVIERCVLFSEDEEFPLRWLQLGAAHRTAAVPAGEGVWLPLDGSLSLEDMERKLVEAALAQADGNVTGAARLLKSTRETLRYRVDKFGLGKG